MYEHTGKQFGKYRLIKGIGAGGMGEVYLAEHVGMEVHYALKVLSPRLAQAQDFVARFREEGRVMAKLQHAHIVRVHDMGETEGAYYSVMDYVVGPEGEPLSLRDCLKQKEEAEDQKRLPEEDVRRWAIQMAEALAYIHKRNVVHRDLKPANILLDDEENARLTDFGLAKVIGNDAILSQIGETQKSLGSLPTTADRGAERGADTLDVAQTLSPESGVRSASTSGILGTYDYMSPEQRREGGPIDHRADFYSFGLVLYVLLTGKRATYGAEKPSQLVPGLSRGWDAIVQRCLAEAPDQRYSSAKELLAHLRSLVGGRARHRGVLAVTAVVCVALVAWLSFMGWQWSQAVDAQERCRTSKDTAILRKAERLADTLWNEAEDRRVKAAEAYVSIRLGRARDLWDEAAGKFDLAAECADALIAQQQCAAAFDAVVDQDCLDKLGVMTAWNNAQASRRAADAAFDAREFVRAKETYEVAIGQLEEVNAATAELPNERGAAQQSESEAEEARELAVTAQAHEFATEDWDTAEEALGQAVRYFAGCEYGEAESSWIAARAGYEKAAESAWNQRVSVAQGQYDSLLTEQDQNVLSRYVLGEWQGITEALSEALQRAKGEAAVQIAAYVQATEELRQLVVEARATHGSEQAKRAECRKALEEAERIIDTNNLEGRPVPVEPTQQEREAANRALDLVNQGIECGHLDEEDQTRARQLQQLLRKWNVLEPIVKPPVSDPLGPHLIRARELAERGGIALGKQLDDADSPTWSQLCGARKALAEVGQALEIDRNHAEAQRLQEQLQPWAEPKELVLYVGQDQVPLELVWIPGGDFTSGYDGRGDPGPPVRVESFYMGKYEVTNEQYRQYQDLSPQWRTSLRKPLDGDRQPVVGVTWLEAASFCDWLRSKTEYRVRLPREVEWEYAVQCGQPSEYPWGDGWPPTINAGNFADLAWAVASDKNTGDIQDWDGFAVSSPVGSFDENGFGLCDMAGNVAEWCRDPYDAGVVGQDPCMDVDPDRAPVRGSSWANNANEELRCAYRRLVSTRAGPDATIGFRVVIRPADCNCEK